ncbi:hypothetical protein ONZ45_g15338 [Pleurotus djamor]|nr:hypothetical protein ONZ45_g15338 [Pleurotus djamor]
MPHALPASLISLIPIPECPAWATQAEYRLLRRYFERFIRTFGTDRPRASLWEDLWAAFSQAGVDVDTQKKTQIKNWFNRQNLVIQALRIVAQRFPETRRDTSSPNVQVQRDVIVLDHDDEEDGNAGRSDDASGSANRGKASVAHGSTSEMATHGASSSSGTVKVEPCAAEDCVNPPDNSSVTISLPDFETLFRLPIGAGDAPSMSLPRPTPFPVCTLIGMSSSVHLSLETQAPGRGRQIIFGLDLPIRPITTECRFSPKGAILKSFDGRNTSIVIVPLPLGYKEEDFSWRSDYPGRLSITVTLPS